MPSNETVGSDRAISLGEGLPAIPERLLLAHAQGRVLFVCGAGISVASKLPSFRRLVIDVYKELDANVHGALVKIPDGACNLWDISVSDLDHRQTAEVKRFINGDYDVVLGMLERRLDNETDGDSTVRKTVEKNIRTGSSGHAAIHRALMRLADRGGATSIVTTNFDLLLEEAALHIGSPAKTFSLGSMPRPTKKRKFNGVIHIHGALGESSSDRSEFILSDQDFGEMYLRRRIVSDFIYDAARLFCIVLVGYSASDPPMRYLLNAVAADSSHFDDLRDRYTFAPEMTPDPIANQDWRARGIIPIQYDAKEDHLALLKTLERWADLSAHGNPGAADQEVIRIVHLSRAAASEIDRDLFDHLVRRSSAAERLRISKLASKSKADVAWLNAILNVSREKGPMA